MSIDLMERPGGLELKAAEPGRLAAEARVGPAEVTLVLSGAAETQDREALTLLVKRTHELMQRVGLKRINVDFADLKFMNSSCFKDLVSWIVVVQESPRDARYTLCFRYDPKVRWLRGSMHALSTFGVDVVQLETTGGTP